MQSFRDLEAYKISKEVVVWVYESTKAWPREELFGLTSQLRRSAVSIPSNIAEGCGRVSSKDTLHFLAIARGSCYELEAQADLAVSLGLLTNSQFDHFLSLNDRIRRLLHGLMNRYQSLPS